MVTMVIRNVMGKFVYSIRMHNAQLGSPVLKCVLNRRFECGATVFVHSI